MIGVARIGAETHAQQCYPREACGVLVSIDGRTKYWPCRNLAEPDATDHFVLSPEDYAAADAAGEIVGIVHSHPDAAAEPSEADRVACEASGLPWYIVSVPGGQWAALHPSGYQAPLIGRTWAHGVLDCYSLIRDWYRIEAGILLPDYDRQDNWWHSGKNLYLDFYRDAGFSQVADENPQAGDVLLMQILANVPNHGAIYLGDDVILHHLANRLSCREIYGGYFKKHTYAVLRHERIADSLFAGRARP